MVALKRSSFEVYSHKAVVAHLILGNVTKQLPGQCCSAIRFAGLLR